MSSTNKPKLSPEEMEQLQKERRNQEAFAQRAKIAAAFIPSLIKIYPDKTDAEIIDKATSLTEAFMDKLLGVKFETKDA